MNNDEILMAEVREQLRDQGLEDDEIDFQITVMADEGCFRCEA
jgi:hypothetical protein